MLNFFVKLQKFIFYLLKLIINFIKLISHYIIVLLIWQFIILKFNIPNYILPSPLDIFKYIIKHKNLLFNNTLITSFEAIGGLILACITTIILGAFSLYSTSLVKITYKLLLLIQIIPLMAIAPLIIIWIGFGIFAKIIIVFIICLFPCLISFLRGSNNIDKEFFSLLQSMGAKKWNVFKLIIFPSSCYSLFSGLKIAVTYSVTGAVIAEYLGSEKGIGVYLARAISSFDNNALFANIFCIIFATLIFYKTLLIIEKFTTPWNNNINKKERFTNEYL